ncbi:MAG TPA: DUF1579 domain-containing protein [Allosphingosinicella sp.]|nr:DUF1579 domain-containing protein [Allosphingosinicella sp.]
MTNTAPLCLLLGLLAATAAPAQTVPQPTPEQAAAGPWDPARRIAEQRRAMAALSFMDGAWRGDAQAAQRSGGFVQTERVGVLLDGTVRVVEGRGYDAAGATVFNAFGIISYDPVRRAYSMRSYAMGFAGDFPMTVRADGFSWSHPAEPGVTMRYNATIRDGEWHEVGERVADGAAPVRAFEMRLRRIGPSDWPRAGAVPPR